MVPAGGVIGISGGTLEADNFVVDSGKIFQKGNETTTNIDMSSAQDMTIRAADDISLAPADALRISHGNGVGDGVVFTAQTLNFLISGAGGFYLSLMIFQTSHLVILMGSTLLQR